MKVVALCGEVDEVCEKVVRCRVLVLEMAKFGVLVLVVRCDLITAVEFGWVQRHTVILPPILHVHTIMCCVFFQ